MHCATITAVLYMILTYLTISLIQSRVTRNGSVNLCGCLWEIIFFRFAEVESYWVWMASHHVLGPGMSGKREKGAEYWETYIDSLFCALDVMWLVSSSYCHLDIPWTIDWKLELWGKYTISIKFCEGIHYSIRKWKKKKNIVKHEAKFWILLNSGKILWSQNPDLSACQDLTLASNMSFFAYEIKSGI